MADIVGKTEAFLRKYGLDPALVDVDACTRAFQADMEKGLRGDPDAWMMMLPTYLSLDGENVVASRGKQEMARYPLHILSGIVPSPTPPLRR